MNIAAQAAIDDPALGRPNPRTAVSIPRRLPHTLINKALPVGRDRRCGRAQRADGWTPLRIRAFLEVLARSGSVAAAARAAGMSRQSAYALRSSAKGQAFDDAWRSALLLAGPCIPDEILDRAINGGVEPIIRKGEVWGERHRFDNRLSLKVLRRLDKLAESQSAAARAIRAVAEEFEAFLEIVSSGDEEQADAFLRSRCATHRRGETQTSDLSSFPDLERAESVDPPVQPAASSEGPAWRREPPNVSSLPIDKSGASSSCELGRFTHLCPRLEKAARGWVDPPTAGRRRAA